MRSSLRLGAAILLAATPVLSESGEAPVLVELFTSQGCSSCPPADGIIAELAERSDVIALSLHVDYWDYLGWRDSFGSAEHTARQKAYAKAMNERTIYTPQVIVAGQKAVVGSHRESIESVILTLAQRDEVARVAVTVSETEISVDVRSIDAGWHGAATVSMAYLSDREVVEIGAGENAGRVAIYRNVVIGWRTLGEWGGETARFSAPRSNEADSIVVIVQDNITGYVISCTKY